MLTQLKVRDKEKEEGKSDESRIEMGCGNLYSYECYFSNVLCI